MSLSAERWCRNSVQSTWSLIPLIINYSWSSNDYKTWLVFGWNENRFFVKKMEDVSSRNCENREHYAYQNSMCSTIWCGWEEVLFLWRFLTHTSRRFFLPLSALGSGSNANIHSALRQCLVLKVLYMEHSFIYSFWVTALFWSACQWIQIPESLGTNPPWMGRQSIAAHYAHSFAHLFTPRGNFESPHQHPPPPARHVFG